MHTEFGGEVQLIIIYVIDAHPVGSACPYTGEEWTTDASKDATGNPTYQPATYEELVNLAIQAAQELDISSVPVLVDGWDNAVWCTYGPAPNIAYLISTDGGVVEKQGWYDPNTMRKAIMNYVDGL